MRTDPDGIAAVRIARRSVAEALGAPPDVPAPARVPDGFDAPRGAFVTLRRHPSGSLRGCIGYPLPRFPLATAIARAARAAALDDPRFPPLRAPELGAITVEVSALTAPERIAAASAEEIVRSVRVGRDGLIVEGRGESGLLLPQVAPEQGWNEEELLAGTCEKAGLPADAWRSGSVRVYRFEAEVFAEVRPAGPVERVGEEVTPAGGRPAPRT